MYCLNQPLGLKRVSLIIFIFFIVFKSSFADVKTWTGAGADGQWSTPANWNGNSIPIPGDDVLLDNTVIAVNYTVTLPNSAVVIKTLTIVPGAGKLIEVLLPASNILQPAFTATGPGYGLLINDGGTFQNASGMVSGESLNIADSIRINNGGRYIHRTKASHANNIVRLLSSTPGTENGIFEFDVPRVSYTVSVSNRIYGAIVFSAVAAGGAITYTCTGSNTFTVNGNLQINPGVNLSIDLASANGNIIVKGDYIQNGGVFNLASGAGNSTVARIQGNLLQLPAGQITETNTGLPVIELNGLSTQTISLAGTVTNSVNFRMNNPAGATLSSPLQLPYKLELLQGRITTSPVNLLTLQSSCVVITDSTIANTSFINGPLRKEGLLDEQFFLFPVGKNTSLRWLELKNVSGNFVVEYFNNNPRLLSNTYGAGIDHISASEYWTVNADAGPVPMANVELSFVVPGSGQITDLAFLNVASLSSGTWTDAGHTGITGTFNTSGSVISNPVNNFPAAGYFTLASTANLQNPLPIVLIDFNGRMMNNEAIFNWQIDLPEDADFFELMTKTTNDFTVISRLPAIRGKKQYQFSYDSMQNGISYFRLRVTDKNGISYLSKVIAVNNNKSDFTLRIAPTLIAGNRAILQINTPHRDRLQWLITSMDGKIINNGSINIEAGSNTVSLELPRLAAGIYQLVAVNEKKQFCSIRFIKQ